MRSWRILSVLLHDQHTSTDAHRVQSGDPYCTHGSVSMGGKRCDCSSAVAHPASTRRLVTAVCQIPRQHRGHHGYSEEGQASMLAPFG